MNLHLHSLQPDRAAALLRSYDAALAQKRRQAWLFGLVLAVCAALSAWAGEVDLRKFLDGLPRF